MRSTPVPLPIHNRRCESSPTTYTFVPGSIDCTTRSTSPCTSTRDNPTGSKYETHRSPFAVSRRYAT